VRVPRDEVRLASLVAGSIRCGDCAMTTNAEDSDTRLFDIELEAVAYSLVELR